MLRHPKQILYSPTRRPPAPPRSPAADVRTRASRGSWETAGFPVTAQKRFREQSLDTRTPQAVLHELG